MENKIKKEDKTKGDRFLMALGLSFILFIGILSIAEFSTAYKSEKVAKKLIPTAKIKKGILDSMNEFFIEIALLVILILFVFSWLCNILTAF
ncbi:MAG: hypothetical protein QW802_04365 [Candidatus Altiarchaeota archaeon]